MPDTELKIDAIGPWLGSKGRLAPLIVEQLGPHQVYWELCLGGGAGLLAKPPAKREMACDTHGDLVNLCSVLAHPQAGPALGARLRRTIFNEAVFNHAARQLARLDLFDNRPDPAAGGVDTERAYYTFVAWWMGMGGLAGTDADPSISIRFEQSGGAGGSRFRSAVESIPALIERMRHVMVYCRDAHELIPKIDDAEKTAIYLDPPYPDDGAQYAKHTIDHRLLRKQLGRFKKTRIVLSYRAHPLIDELYADWTRIEVEVNTQAGVNRSGERPATELLLVNGPRLGSDSPKKKRTKKKKDTTGGSPRKAA